jgi:RNA polymerase sigma factor for flagellar operon FliA
MIALMTAACTLSPASDSPDVMVRLREGLPLVDMICHQLRKQLGPAVRMDDLVSYGREGLLAAARSFDPSRGVPFRRWANLRVRGAVLDGVRASSIVPRSIYARLRALEAAERVRETLSNDGSGQAKTAEDADKELSEYLGRAATAMALGFATSTWGEGEPSDGAPGAEARLMREELLQAIRAAIRELPDVERRLLERHYFEDVTFEHAASELGLSKSWASRLHSRAIGYVTRSLKRSRWA